MTARGCLDPANCPVPTPPGPLGRRRPTPRRLPADTPFFRVGPHAYGYGDFNPGSGSGRFAPFVDENGTTVPTLYGGKDETVVLLETVFHEVSTGERTVYESRLREQGLVHATTPMDLMLLDLRDRELTRLGLSRQQLVTADAAHYACTREWARYLHGRSYRPTPPQGLLWHSRQAELAGEEPTWVFVLFGDRVPTGPGSWPLVGPGVRNLVEGRGRLLIEEIANRLGAVIVPS